MRKLATLLVLVACSVLTTGCGGDGNTVIDPVDNPEADAAMMEMTESFESSTGGGPAGGKGLKK